MTSFRDNLRGIAAMIAANLVYLLNDTLVKLAGDHLPIGEIMFLRGIVASLTISAIAVALGQHRQISRLFHRAVFWRVGGEIAAALLFINALLHMPIADITTVLQVVPLMTTAAGALFLAERVGWHRWTAIVVGFVGVLIVLRPGGDGFNIFGLVAFGAMFFVTLRDMSTRVIPLGVPTMLVATLTSIATTAAGAVLGLGEQWSAPDWQSLSFCAGAGLFIAAGYWLSIIAMRSGDVSVVAPFRYSVILWAILIGFLVWGDVPDLPMVVGSVIIILTGLYAFSRERRHARLIAGTQL